MANMQANDRNLMDFFSERDAIKYDKKIFVIDDIFLSSDGMSITSVDVKNTITKNLFKKGLDQLLADNFSGDIKSNVEKVGNKYKFSIKTIGTTTGGRIPADIHEAGTVLVFNRVLQDNQEFNSGNDILNDEVTYKGLVKIFGSSRKNRINEWCHSYYEQQKVFLKKFRGKKWQPFEYGGQDFVHFFEEQIKNVQITPDKKPVGKYTTWNPSDIWAVYDKDKVVDEIERSLNPSKQSLKELNGLILKLLKQKRLVGISLKKIPDKGGATIKMVNVNPSTMKLVDVESIEMNAIKFDIDNLMPTKNNYDSTSIKYKNGKYSISVAKAGEADKIANLGFTVDIKGSAARHGQVPVEILIEQLEKRTSGNVTFKNSNRDYPRTSQEFKKKSKIYEGYFKSVFGSNSKYDEFQRNVIKLYSDDSTVGKAISKLMQLHFYHDAFISNKNNAEFWTDLLFFGMKMGKRFAPHFKIS